MATATRLQFLHQCILKKKKGCNNNLKTNFLPHHLVWTYLALPNTHSYIKLHIETCKHVRTWRMPWTILCVATLGTRGNVTRVNNWSVSTCTFGLWHSEQFTVNLAHTFF